MDDRRIELDRFQQDIDYYQTHWGELLSEYPEQWVAIFNERVVGASTGLDELLAKVKRKGIPVGRCLVEYVTAKEELLILPS